MHIPGTTRSSKWLQAQAHTENTPNACFPNLIVKGCFLQTDFKPHFTTIEPRFSNPDSGFKIWEGYCVTLVSGNQIYYRSHDVDRATRLQAHEVRRKLQGAQHALAANYTANMRTRKRIKERLASLAAHGAWSHKRGPKIERQNWAPFSSPENGTRGFLLEIPQ